MSAEVVSISAEQLARFRVLAAIVAEGGVAQYAANTLRQFPASIEPPPNPGPEKPAT